MIDAPSLLKDLQRLLKDLEADLRARTAEVPDLDATTVGVSSRRRGTARVITP